MRKVLPLFYWFQQQMEAQQLARLNQNASCVTAGMVRVAAIVATPILWSVVETYTASVI